ncbi:hypothetical protein H0H92_002317 [Tricholoma furcatifolium]|nr:hypothetical protein H0H92_002317 [Tricholoma furcatifolium]
MKKMKTSTDNDPLTLALAPPPNETTSERVAREEAEEHARQVSKQIDLELKLAKAEMKKRQKAIKVLVLGQSMSGKTTTIKNFQMTYAKKSWAEERVCWKAVILLNLVRSINAVVQIIGDELDAIQESDSAHGPGVRVSDHLTDHHRNLILKLVPLRQIERDLQGLLGSGSFENDEVPDSAEPVIQQEFVLRSNSGWKTILKHIRNPNTGKDTRLQFVAFNVITSLKDDIRNLWKDANVQKLLEARQVRLEDAPGFFLHDVDRVTHPDYEPTDADVVRARLRTTGVQEYTFTLEHGTLKAVDCLMYDVAAIIFLAPLSAFNETLVEDPRINSVHDSFSLWKTVCSSKLLASVQIILFMNKTDLLKKKLDMGLAVRDYLPEYKETKHDFVTVTTWFRRMFAYLYKHYTPPGRTLISHFTSVIDTTATAQTLTAVQDVILQTYVTEAGLM